MPSLQVVIAVAAVCCFLGAGIGAGRGQTGAGAFLGLFLGPIGLLLCLTMKDTPEHAAMRAEAIEAERRKLRGEPDPAPPPSLQPPTA